MMYSYVIVDDEPLIRSGIRSKIDSFAESLKLVCAGEANNGREALALIAERDPQIIVTDMRMPGVDGRELLALLKQHYSDKQMIVVSGYKDYEYMMGAIEAQVAGYLLKPFSREEVQAVMAKAIEAIEKAAASRELREKLDDMQAEQERLYEQYDLELCRVQIESGRSGAASAELQSRRGRTLQAFKRYMLLAQYTNEARSVQKTGLRRLADLLREPHEFISEPVLIPGSAEAWLYLVVPLNSEDDSRRVHALAKKSMTEAGPLVDDTTESRLLIAASLPKRELGQLHEAYLECRSAMDACPAAGKYGYSSYFERPSARSERWEETERFVYWLESGSTDKAAEEMNEALFRDNPTWSEVRSRCRQLIEAITNATRQKLLLAPPDWAKEADAVLNDGYDSRRLAEFMQELLQAIESPSRSSGADSSHSLVRKLQSYIEAHYQEELSLQKLAQRFYVNASYCSYIFKEKTGMNISEFVLAKRIAKAKELLERTDYPLDRIARLVGYSNDKYFIRIFKKTTGVTPQAFRQSRRR
ncbi:response regulator [Cohnella hongkongensis]|uniref:Response regulator n=1 Tax=Cohnella hongkongensis TaxID=178337 RepID=A0ABV9FDH7_9BACL